MNNLRALRNSAINMSAPKAPIAMDAPGELRMSISGMLDELDQNPTAICRVGEVDQATSGANSGCVIEHSNPRSANMGGY
jgi:hypothetical protein